MKKQCCVDECERPVHAREKCSTHYVPPSRTGVQCKVDGCDGGLWGKELCHLHYDREFRNRVEIVCEACGTASTGWTTDQRYCSKKCMNSVNIKLALAGRVKQMDAARIQRRLPVLYVGPKNIQPPVIHIQGGTWTAGECRACGEWFLDRHTNITCSDECREAHNKNVRRVQRDRRRARKKGAYVADVHRKDIYARDGHVCHICGEPTDPTQVVPHPKAPTIDHVIPLAKGGTHEPANCATAHFLCNALKRDQMEVVA